MDISNVLNRFRELEEKNILITDEHGKLLYRSVNMDLPPELVLEKINRIPEGIDEQEFMDKEHDAYFSVKKTVIVSDGLKYNCYSVTDIREYTLLIQEVSSYTRSISSMAKFQTSVMKKLSMSYDTFLPGLADYCGSDEVMMFIENSGIVTRSSYTDQLVRVNAGERTQYESYFSMKRGDTIDGFTCILSSTVQQHACVVLVKTPDGSGESDPMDLSVFNVISLFIENCILRDRIVYESEHDKLTGLYNKGKYMALKSISFGKPDTIAIYNFDVNNLKHINDTYGHEYGDALIVMAAKSIAAVTAGNVYGFRMGGDEYVMVAVNLTEAEAEKIHADWKAALDKLNADDTSMFCSMACGMIFGSGDYDYEELYKQADKLMYENKKALKANGITSHLLN